MKSQFNHVWGVRLKLETDVVAPCKKVLRSEPWSIYDAHRLSTQKSTVYSTSKSSTLRYSDL